MMMIDLEEKYLMKMINASIQSEDDREKAHVEMDEVMCELLAELGYESLVKVFTKTPKWYA